MRKAWSLESVRESACPVSTVSSWHLNDLTFVSLSVDAAVALKLQQRGYGDGSVVKSMCGSSSGSKLKYEHPYQVAHNHL